MILYDETKINNFLLIRYFYPMKSAHLLSVLILHPREMQIRWSQTAVRQSE